MAVCKWRWWWWCNGGGAMQTDGGGNKCNAVVQMVQCANAAAAVSSKITA